MPKLFLHELQFIKPAGTSRGVLHTKPSWIYQWPLPNGELAQTEFPVIPGLTPEYESHGQYEQKLLGFLHAIEPYLVKWSNINFLQDPDYRGFIENWRSFPSFVFGLEILLLSMRQKGSKILFATDFTRGSSDIPINGLVWMGSLADMRSQAQQKIAAGFQTVKLKIGALDWQQEYLLLNELRQSASAAELTIRVDANGAFTAQNVKQRLCELAQLEVHSIEQPIAPGQYALMADLCTSSPVAIALDEELIGVEQAAHKIALLETIRPQYLILKPSLHGGFSGVKEWITLAEQRNIGWWLTSALESSIGLSAIVQFGSCYALELPQGFGTGGLYTNNFPSDLTIQNGRISWLNDSHKG
ncbi:MAG: o-succinylbenzoate synthase [Flavobacteriales bacterium]